MAAPILVTGGTGTLGRLVVDRLRTDGGSVRVLSRRPGTPSPGVERVTGDLGTGEGADAAVRGVEVVLHLAGAAKGDPDKARHLIRAASRAGVRHLVFISVVGADRVPVVGRIDRGMFGYFAEQRTAEQIVADSGIGWTTLRATQFHDLALATARQLVKLPVALVGSGFAFQPIEAAEVADRLVELASGPPAGLVPDLAGPRVYPMAELVAGYLRATGRRRPILAVRLPGGAAQAVRDGANLNRDRAVGRRTWEDFLAEHVGQVHPSRA